MWKTIQIATKSRVQFLDITEQIAEEVRNNGIKQGICHLFVPHTTAGITVNENADPDVIRDLTIALAGLVPKSGDYHHIEGNSDAHIKASMMGFSVEIPIIEDKLGLGTWQGIYFCEFDGPRQRKLKIHITE